MPNSENTLLSKTDLNSIVRRRGPARNSIVRRDSSPASSCRIESNFCKGAAEKGNDLCSIGNLPTHQHSVDENDDGFRTPTSFDQKIPAIPACPPPPPRKQKPPASLKRRAPPPPRRVLLDLSNEIELLFPPADLGNINIKKIRQAS